MPTTLTIPATLEQLPLINAYIHANVPERFRGTIPQMELAAEELLVNVYSHAYKNGSGSASVDCREVSFDGDAFVRLSVTDWGAPFDPFADAPEPDLTLDAESRPIGGLGVHLIRSMVRHHCYSRSEQANCIELYFDIKRSCSAGEGLCL